MEHKGSYGLRCDQVVNRGCRAYFCLSCKYAAGKWKDVIAQHCMQQGEQNAFSRCRTAVPDIDLPVHIATHILRKAPDNIIKLISSRKKRLQERKQFLGQCRSSEGYKRLLRMLKQSEGLPGLKPASKSKTPFAKAIALRD